MKIFATTFSDEFGVVSVDVDVAADLRPESVESRHGTSEIDARKIGRGRDGVTKIWTVTWNEVDYSWRHSSFFADFIDPPV